VIVVFQVSVAQSNCFNAKVMDHVELLEVRPIAEIFHL